MLCLQVKLYQSSSLFNYSYKMSSPVISLYLVVGLTVSLVCGQTPTHFMIGQVTVNGTIPITNVGAGGFGGLGINALACFTDSPSTAVWLFPDGSMVPLGSGLAAPNTIFSLRQSAAITLHRGDGFISPGGEYCCGSPTNVNERLCITLASCPLLVLTNGIITYTDPDINSITATHTCNNGYQLSGGSTRTCDIIGSQAGTWSAGTPVCTAVDCGGPPIINEGSRTFTTTTFESTAIYSCNSGYSLSGSGTVSCLSSGSWSTTPTCTATCVDLPTLTNGAITYSPNSSPRLETARATHTCITGYELSGGTVNPRVCQSDRSWSGGDITCLAMCPDLPSLTNGVIGYSPSTTPRLEGATATYSCADGYQLSSDITRTCVDSGTGGTWNGMEPICLALTAEVVPPGDPPAAGQSYSLMCTVTGAGSLNPTINYQWFKTTPNRTQVGTNSPTLTFDPLVLSDAGHYTCEATISSSQLSQVVTICSNEYEIRFATLNIQLRFNGVPDCGQYTLLDPNLKTHDITTELVQGVESLCGCGFNTTFISSPSLQCFEDSPQHVTYRAVLTETNNATTVQLVSYIKQWTASTQTLVVQSVRLGINTTCPVVIIDFNSPECPEAINVQSTSPPPTVTDPIAPLPTDPLPGNNGAIIGGMVAGVFVLVIIVAAVIVIVLVGVRHRKSGSKDVKNNTRIVESQPVVLSEINQPSLPYPTHPQPYETVVGTESYEYEDLRSFQEGDNYEQVGHPSGPPKGNYDFTQCPAYAMNNVSGQRGAPATQVTQGDDIQYEN